MLKTVFTWLVVVISTLGSIAGIGAWLAPEAPKGAGERFGALVQSFASFANTTVSVPIWALAPLALVMGLAFYLGQLSARPTKDPEPQLDDLSLNELRVVQALISADGNSISVDQAVNYLRSSKLIAEAALSELERMDLVDSSFIPLAGSLGGLRYRFTEKGRALALAGHQRLDALMIKKSTRL